MTRELDLREPGGYLEYVVTADMLPAGAQQADAPLGLQAVALTQLATEIAGARRGTPPVFAADPAPTSTSLGASIVHLTQTVHDIPVLFSSQVVRFAVGGAAQRAEGRLTVREDVPFLITRSAEAAAREAVRFLDDQAHDDPATPAQRSDLTSFTGEVIADFPALATRPTVLAAGPLAQPVTANLGWVPVAGELVLCWDLMLAISEQEGIYRVIVTADAAERTGPVIFSAQTGAALCTALVYEIDPGTERTSRTMPRPWTDHGTPDTTLPSTPPDWVSADATEGYSVLCLADGSPAPVSASTEVDGIAFAPEDALGMDERVVNAFYGACSMHDWFYLRGFRESDGSFQAGGVSAAGTACKKMLVRPSGNPSPQIAAWYGGFKPARLVLELEKGTRLSSALDMTIIAHEYMHAVSAKLVAGGSKPNPFTGQQCAGMYEGLSDFIAVTVTGRDTIGTYVKNNSTGLRRFPYDENFPRTTVHFGRLPEMATYQIGELWCAVLIAARRVLGADLMVQVLLDSLRALPESPSLLAARDAIALALGDHLDAGQMTTSEHQTMEKALLKVFFDYGMGPDASADGVTLSTVEADGPPDLVPLPD